MPKVKNISKQEGINWDESYFATRSTEKEKRVAKEAQTYFAIM